MVMFTSSREWGPEDGEQSIEAYAGSSVTEFQQLFISVLNALADVPVSRSWHAGAL